MAVTKIGVTKSKYNKNSVTNRNRLLSKGDRNG